jgi:hypothetical protein
MRRLILGSMMTLAMVLIASVLYAADVKVFVYANVNHRSAGNTNGINLGLTIREACKKNENTRMDANFTHDFLCIAFS